MSANLPRYNGSIQMKMAKGAKISVNGLKMSAKYLMSDVVKICGQDGR